MYIYICIPYKYICSSRDKKSTCISREDFTNNSNMSQNLNLSHCNAT